MFAKLKDWDAFAITDSGLITGQNSASPTSAAKALLDLLARSAASWTGAGRLGFSNSK
jgi:putative intracellular protease/amidase